MLPFGPFVLIFIIYLLIADGVAETKEDAFVYIKEELPQAPDVPSSLTYAAPLQESSHPEVLIEEKEQIFNPQSGPIRRKKRRRRRANCDECRHNLDMERLLIVQSNISNSLRQVVEETRNISNVIQESVALNREILLKLLNRSND